MKHREAEQLLGGYATGTLTEAERQCLFAAALEHQEVFDALADEEALRELLADPAARAQLLAALAPAAPRKVVPLWRRTGVLGAAASLLVASLAGLAYLRSPDKTPPPLESKEKAKAPSAAQEPTPGQAPAGALPKAALPSPRQRMNPSAPMAEAAAPLPSGPPAGSGPAPAPGVKADQRAVADPPRQLMEARRTEARDDLAVRSIPAKKAEASQPPPASAVEVVAAVAPPPVAAKAKVMSAPPGSVPGGLVGGTMGRASQGLITLVPAPTWALETLAGGVTRATVTTAQRVHPVLLRRRGSAVAVLAPLSEPVAVEGGTRWQFETRLEGGDVLDLYVLAEPVADPTALPETGPAGGFRARIHPPQKKSPAP